MSREKKRACTHRQLCLLLVILILLLLPACTAVEAISASPPLETTGQWGNTSLPEPETEVMTGSQRGLSYTLLLPRFDIVAVDNAVASWAEETVDGVLEQHEAAIRPGSLCSLFADYQIYEVHGQLLRLDLLGALTSNGDDAVTTMDKTLYIDFQEGCIKPLEDLVDFDKLRTVIELIFKKNQEADAETNTTESILVQTVSLKDNNMHIALERIENNTKNAVNHIISFQKLGSILRFGEYALQESELLQREEENNKQEVESLSLQTEPEEPWSPREIDPDKPMIAFTFDDGPSAVTDSILDLLEEHRVKATFFMIGTQIDSFPETLLRMHELQSELANHTWDHRAKLPKRGKEAIRQQIQDTIDKIEEVTGQRATLVRPPYGEVDARVKAIAKELGVYLVNWSIDTNDWKHRDVDMTVEEVLKKVKNGSIILFHDLYEPTVEAVAILIPQLLEQGYQFVTVSELFSYSTREIVPGELYRYQ